MSIKSLKSQSFVNGCSFTNGKSFTNGNSFINGCTSNINIRMKRKKKITPKHIFPILVMIILICSTIFLSIDKQSEEVNDVTINEKRADIIVDINGNGDYTSIQTAINNANPDDTLFVWAGTYNENLVIDKTLTIIGNSSANTMINGGGSGDVMYITADWVNISGFYITNSGSSSGDAGIQINNADYCTIEDCEFYDNYKGIYLYYSDNNNIINNNCSNNNNGIQVSNSGYNNITNNTCYDNDEVGILVGDLNNRIENNTCSNNGYYEIHLYNADNTIVTNNICLGNDYYGIKITYSDSNTITNNTYSDSLYGMVISSNSNYNTITYNDITNNDYYGIYIYSSCDNNDIHHNNFIDNRNGGTQAYDSGTNNDWDDSSAGNYWDDWTSPDVVPPFGIVDDPYVLAGSGGAAEDEHPLENPV